MQSIVLVVHDVRSCHNVGSLLRTADGLAVDKVYLTGYTPYPLKEKDSRLPHLAKKINKQISKTSLGAETSVSWNQSNDVQAVINHLIKAGFEVAALEQTQKSMELPKFKPPNKVALVVGSEIGGIDQKVLKMCDKFIEIPMLGKKESFNVASAAAIALYHLRFY